MNTQQHKPHSADYFGEVRDYWWNLDFLELMSNRLSLRNAHTVLDVGCGVGHWGQLLSHVLSPSAQVTGIDREETWIKQARERADSFGLGNRYHYQIGDVNALAFKDHQFDFVTCQTLLIHLKDPKQGLQEMLRVLKPGGLLLAAEPNNISSRAVGSSLTEDMPTEDIVDRIRFGYIVERGKKALGLGYNSVGDFIPGYLAMLGAENINVYLSDKASPLFSPYSSREQQVNVQHTRDWTKRKFIGWDRNEVLSYFIAGGGHADEFGRLQKLLIKDSELMIDCLVSNSMTSTC